MDIGLANVSHLQESELSVRKAINCEAAPEAQTDLAGLNIRIGGL
jgi:hypothetical protein